MGCAWLLWVVVVVVVAGIEIAVAAAVGEVDKY